ncbi:alpha/beta fold hydrolase [Amycolatopsis nigrescens]|uniref:alpha/beta fold hydrolase n=1 Tax=Amycolatopsis nigrescens TaxID=381445 RepID=UPI000375F0A0|nr:alpha/beta fold hydrolase [Amycolatopsis nigrescens]
MSKASVNGITVGYDDLGGSAVGAGSDVEPPLVLVHGHPFDRSMWRPQVQRFGRTGRRVLAADLRGYGESTVVPGKTSLSTFAEDLAALLDLLGVADIVLGGLSMGGQIVLEFYRLFPDRVRGLLLADTFAQAETGPGRQARYDLADRLVREGMTGYANEILPKMVAPDNIRTLPAVAAQVWDMMAGAPAEGAAAALRGRAERPDYSALLSAIAVPALVVVGREDEFTPVADAEFMSERIPGAELAVIEGAGHLPNLERESAFNIVTARFLETVGAHRPGR